MSREQKKRDRKRGGRAAEERRTGENDRKDEKTAARRNITVLRVRVGLSGMRANGPRF